MGFEGSNPSYTANSTMKLVKEIKSKEGAVHFRRWAFFETKFLSIYYHEIFKADEDPHLHNHPWNIFTLILSGAYIEELENKKHVYRGKWTIANRARARFHKIKELLSNKVTTLAICYGKRGEWGYRLSDTVTVSNAEYRKLKHAQPYEFVNHRKQ